MIEVYVNLIVFSATLSILVGCLIAEVRAARKISAKMKRDLTIFHRSHGRHWVYPPNETKPRSNNP